MSFFSIRDAIANDCEDIMALINELASFENMRDKVQVTAERASSIGNPETGYGGEGLREDGFGPDTFFKCIVAEAKIKEDEKLTVVGYALYFFIYSTFEGRSSFLEDLYVKKDYRGQGIGTALWKHVAKEAVNKRCTRMDFAVLSWNADATKVYKKQGAVDISERDHWHLWRLEEDALKQFASAT